MSVTLFLRYLYEVHPAHELAAWAKRLQYFRFCRAYGGHANDGDQLLLALGFANQEELLAIYQHLGIVDHRVPLDTPQPVPGVSYTFEQYQQFPAIVQTLPTMAQPKHVQIAGVRVFGWVRPDRLELSLSDPDSPYDVTELSIVNAERVEALLAPLADRVIDPPQDNSRCICPKWHRYLFT